MSTLEASPYNKHSPEKRALDIVTASIGLGLTAPIAVGVAAAVKLEDGGHAITRTTRTTGRGAEFSMMKFRSLVLGRENEAATVEVGSSRITKVGAKIRPIGADELPQLVHVLAGDMSIVGPRPLDPEHKETMIEESTDRTLADDWDFARSQVLGGMIGPRAPHLIRQEYTPQDMRDELEYIANGTLEDDVRIIGEHLMTGGRYALQQTVRLVHGIREIQEPPVIN